MTKIQEVNNMIQVSAAIVGLTVFVTLPQSVVDVILPSQSKLLKVHARQDSEKDEHAR